MTCILLEQKEKTDGGHEWLEKLVPLHGGVMQKVSGRVRLVGSSADFIVPWGDGQLKEAKQNPSHTHVLSQFVVGVPSS